jgi:prephenate dehydrogenase
MRQIHIIGGGGGIGRWLIDNVFKNTSPIICYDSNLKSLNTLSAEVISCLIKDNGSYSSYRYNFREGDWIFFALPIPEFEKALKAIVPYLKNESLVISLASDQGRSSRFVKSIDDFPCSYLGCHPLFGHTVISPAGHIIALTDFDTSDMQHKILEIVLKNAGFVITKLSVADHDKFMSYVQALTHFCLLGFASTLVREGLQATDLMKVKTPNFQFLHAFASRVLKLAPTTTGSIQAADDASSVRMKFLETLNELHDNLNTSSINKCAAVIDGIRTQIAGDEMDEGAETASIAVDSLQRFEELIYRYRESGSPFIFLHKRTGYIKIIRIVDISQKEVTYLESTRLILWKDEKRYAIGLTDNAKRNYRRIGINFKTNKIESRHLLTIKKRHIQLLTSDAIHEFYRSNVLLISIVKDFANPYNHDMSYFEEWLPLLINGIIQCEFIESLARKNEIPKVKIKLTFDPNEDMDTLITNVKAAIEQKQFSSR